ncbi:AEC family transporter [Halobacillus shinanisalinarum]|uniref:AEC family transporter n=1 Tax=Halobacillus shinanisalinarum TaxID=2932258 RepID=A0ABY4H1Y9_9BACI|nr:AEC family transporter [Halobacillus shinanisalinarum]UOQ94450.1 AEC family transporter [Halobacillus shinanisalinarum]
MTIFFQVVLPVVLVFLAGFVLQKFMRLEIKSLSTVVLYIMLPCLVFETFYQAEFNNEYIMMLVFSVLLLFSILLINKVVAKVVKFDTSIESGMILSTAFMNAGNYGAPIVLFAFGEAGFVYSVSFMVLQQIVMNFFGVYYAAKGAAGVRMAISTVLKMPPTYAVIIALIMKFLPITISENLMSSVSLVGNATIPTVMILLGMQLANITVKSLDWGKISYAATLRLVGSPLIAWGLTVLLPMSDLMANVLIISAAMPSAATTTMYAVQFDSKPDLVSSITLITTIISVVTIPLVLNILT